MQEILADKYFYNILNKYISNSCFDQNDLKPSNPYVRPINKDRVLSTDFSSSVGAENLLSEKNLILHRLLFTIYEQDLLFLNFTDDGAFSYFKMFYDPQLVAYGKTLKPTLEYLAFNFLQDEIEIIGNWDKTTAIKYLSEIIAEEEITSSRICHSITSAKDPTLAAKMLLIQMAPDFLTEASSMARTLPGSFGAEQSEIMKIFIDEYGYGVHSTKHSTLFEDTLVSAGLNPAIHYYYNDYLATSLMLVNYYHYISSNKLEWFRYMGTLYYTEASVPHLHKQLSSTFKKNLAHVNTRYFDEHVHIDTHHRRMVIDKIISSSIDKYGDRIIDDILSGFESFRMLQRIADDDVIKRIQFIDEHKSNSR
jgi:hypothetical protein